MEVNWKAVYIYIYIYIHRMLCLHSEIATIQGEHKPVIVETALKKRLIDVALGQYVISLQKGTRNSIQSYM